MATTTIIILIIIILILLKPAVKQVNWQLKKKNHFWNKSKYYNKNYNNYETQHQNRNYITSTVNNEPQKLRHAGLKLFIPRFFANAESELFEAINHDQFFNKFYICPKVRLLDLVDVKRLVNNPNQEQEEKYQNLKKYFTENIVKNMHVDFLLINQRDYSPVLVIELDGKSHDSEHQMFLDETKDVQLQKANIDYVRLKQDMLTIDEMIIKIKEKLKWQ